MKYISTRGDVDPVGFKQAVMMGLARDGGLLLPESIPDVSDRLNAWADLSYVDLAFEVMSLFTDLPEDDLRTIIQRSYSTFRDDDVTPLVEVGGIHILELFHGPTLAFKDLALQFLGNIFEYILEEENRYMNIIGATSGDTGSAAIYGVRGMERIKIFIMHPDGKVSPVQKAQMTSVLDDNIFNLAVAGTFDDCQGILKTLFNDLEFKDKHSLGSINSINWARILAQVVYYFYAGLQVMKNSGSETVRFSVPTGNFGDIFAGYIASKMGLPISKLILATNENDILSRFFNSGRYYMGSVNATISPSMDIQIASNFERYLYYWLNEDSVKLKSLMEQFTETGEITIDLDGADTVDPLFAAGRGDTNSTLATIKKFYNEYSYLLDPHTAVGVCVGLQHKGDDPLVCLSTAHPAKFGGAIKDALGRDEAYHPVLAALDGLPMRCEFIPNSATEVRKYVEQRVH
jgi:threonine synthase